MVTNSNFVEPYPDGEEPEEPLDFVADSPKGVVREQSSGGDDRAASAPQDEIEDHRAVAYTDPHVREALMTLLDWIVGDGFSIQPRPFSEHLESGGADLEVDSDLADVPADEDQQKALAAKLERLLRLSEFWPVWEQWVQYAMIDGHSFMELVVEDGVFKPKLLPTEDMGRKVDEFGQLEYYELDTGEDDPIKYDPHEVAELWFLKDPMEDFGRSLVEPIAEQADILRDMELDYARFVATKAYPPILWKLGTEEEKWTEPQIQGWLDTIEQIEPDSMLAAGHDVDYDLVGVTSTSSTAGAMRLEETFKHFQDRIVTGLGVPAMLMNMEGGGNSQGEAVAAMPAFKRRIRRYQNRIKTATEQQILRSLMFNSLEAADQDKVVPEFEFGEYSAAEERLDADKAMALLNNGLLTPEAAARRAGIDPDSELPDIWDGDDLLNILQILAGVGDNVQNPNGGSPTDTEGGTESSGGEATSRQDPGSDSSSGRSKKSVTEDEN